MRDEQHAEALGIDGDVGAVADFASSMVGTQAGPVTAHPFAAALSLQATRGRSLSRRRQAGGRRPPHHGSVAEVPVARTRQTAADVQRRRGRRRPPASPALAVDARRRRSGPTAPCAPPASRPGRWRTARPLGDAEQRAQRRSTRSVSGWTPSHTAPRPSSSASIRMFSVAAEQSWIQFCGHFGLGPGRRRRGSATAAPRAASCAYGWNSGMARPASPGRG